MNNTLNIKEKLMVLMHRAITLFPEPECDKKVKIQFLKEFRSKSVFTQIAIMSLVYILCLGIPIIFLMIMIPSLVHLFLIVPVIFLPLIPILIAIGFFALVSKMDLDMMDIDINSYERWGK